MEHYIIIFQEFCSNLFNLFDESSQGFLVQDDWISHLKNTCAPGDESEDESRRDQEKLDLVELLEAVTYLVCQENHVVPDTFYKVLASPAIRHSSSLSPDLVESRCGDKADAMHRPGRGRRDHRRGDHVLRDRHHQPSVSGGRQLQKD